MEKLNFFKDVYGQEKIKEKFSRAIDNKRLHHAYLFSGPAGIGKEAFALELMKIINCETQANGYCGKCRSCRELKSYSSEDLFYIFPDINKKADTQKIRQENSELLEKAFEEKGNRNGYGKFSFSVGKTITIDQIKNIRKYSQYNSIRKSKKFVVIYPADKMNKEAQNSLLKVLEEPPVNFHFILITENRTLLLQTIVSRCQNIDFPQLRAKEIERYIELNLDRSEIDFVPAEMAERAEGSIDNLMKLLSVSGRKLMVLEDKLVDLFRNSTPPATIDLIDDFIAVRKNSGIPEADIETIFKVVATRLARELKGDGLGKVERESMELVIKSFSNFLYMVKRNLNYRILMINLYLNYREELKKCKM